MEAYLGAHLQAGKLALKEDVSEGLHQAADAFRRLMAGRTFGKALVKMADWRRTKQSSPASGRGRQDHRLPSATAPPPSWGFPVSEIGRQDRALPQFSAKLSSRARRYSRRLSGSSASTGAPKISGAKATL